MKYFQVYDKNTVVCQEIFALWQQTTTQTSLGFDISAYEGLLSFFLHTGDTNQGTLTVTVQTSHDDSTYVALAPLTGGTGFTAITTSNGGIYALNYDVEKARKYIRVVGTIAGTATVTYSVYFLGKKNRGITA